MVNVLIRKPFEKFSFKTYAFIFTDIFQNTSFVEKRMLWKVPLSVPLFPKIPWALGASVRQCENPLTPPYNLLGNHQWESLSRDPHSWVIYEMIYTCETHLVE